MIKAFNSRSKPVLLGLACFFALAGLLMAGKAYCLPLSGTINQDVTIDQVAKYKDLIADVATRTANLKIKYHSLPTLDFVRLEAPDLCIQDKCLTFVFQSCAVAICPYGSAIVSNNFFISDYQSDFLPATVTIQFLSKDEFKTYFLIGNNYVAIYVRQ